MGERGRDPDGLDLGVNPRVSSQHLQTGLPSSQARYGSQVLQQGRQTIQLFRMLKSEAPGRMGSKTKP